MRGNSAIMKCLIPSFVADFVYVEAWIDESGVEFKLNERESDSLSGGNFRIRIQILWNWLEKFDS